MATLEQAATGRVCAEDIVASRRRSELYGIDPTTREPPFQGDPSPSAKALTDLSEPLLSRLVTDITGTSIGLVLADRGGTVTYRSAGGRPTMSAMDGRAIAVGFCLAESEVGTNGVGTSLEAGRATLVIGEDHYLEAFKDFTCAHAPIRHPVTRRIAGTIGVICPAEQTSSLLLPTATRLAAQIADVLLDRATADERRLLDAFLRYRRRTADAVATVNERIFIGTPAATQHLRDVDQADLWDRVRAALRSGTETIAEVPRPESPPLRLRCRPLLSGGRVEGAVVEVITTPVARARSSGRDTAVLGTLVGLSHAWQMAVSQALVAVRTEEPCVVIGERGTGRRSVAEAIGDAGPAGRMRVIDAAERLLDGSQAWTERCAAALGERATDPSPATVILCHVDQLPGEVAAALGALLDRRAPHIRVIATTAAGVPTDPALASLLDRLAVIRVTLPPLRERRRDIPVLAQDIARRLSPHRLSTEVLRLLRGHDWPGNVTELSQVLRGAIAVADGRTLAVGDLPVHIRVPSGRKALDGLRQQEADAIVAAVTAADGNKTTAAQLLGISRATLYRRIDSYGLSQAV